MSPEEKLCLLLTAMAIACFIGFQGMQWLLRRRARKMRVEALALQAQARELRAGVAELERGLGYVLDTNAPRERKGGHFFPVARVPEPVRAEESTVPLWRRPECRHASGHAIFRVETDATTGLVNVGLRCPDCNAWVQRNCNECGGPAQYVNALNLCDLCARGTT